MSSSPFTTPASRSVSQDTAVMEWSPSTRSTTAHACYNTNGDEPNGWDFGSPTPRSILTVDWTPTAALQTDASCLVDILARFNINRDHLTPRAEDIVPTVPIAAPVICPAIVNSIIADNRGAPGPTCFIFISGDHDLCDYEPKGRFSAIRGFGSFASIHTRARGKETFLYYKDKRDGLGAMNLFRHYHNEFENANIYAQFINVESYCYSTRDLLVPISPIDVGRTFTTGYPGELIVTVRPKHMMVFNGITKTFVADKIRGIIDPKATIEMMTDISNGDPGCMSFRVTLFEAHRADEIVAFFRANDEEDFISNTLVLQCNFYVGISNSGDSRPGTSAQSQDGTAGTGFVDPINHLRNFDADVLSPPTTSTADLYGVIGSSRPSVDSTGLMTPISRSSHTPAITFDPDYEIRTMDRASRAEYLYNCELLQNRRDVNKNIIDVNMIYNGQDVRTTVMLRNIPNRVTHEMLRLILNATLHGCYDFVYLRIDFTNNCNVGYAFINFVHPKDVAKFVENVAGQKWYVIMANIIPDGKTHAYRRRHSDKVAEVSYASFTSAMQGRETLIQKFRNSSVMLEVAESRPKLYHAMPHAKAGKEEEFPAPDNFFKLARSNQNAAHIGLYSPSRGGSGLARMQRLQGRYDRGTSFALLERMMAENAMLRNMHGPCIGRGDAFN